MATNQQRYFESIEKNSLMPKNNAHVQEGDKCYPPTHILVNWNIFPCNWMQSMALVVVNEDRHVLQSEKENFCRQTREGGCYFCQFSDWIVFSPGVDGGCRVLLCCRNGQVEEELKLFWTWIILGLDTSHIRHGTGRNIWKENGKYFAQELLSLRNKEGLILQTFVETREGNYARGWFCDSLKWWVGL